MDSKKLVDKITLQYLSSNRLKNLNISSNNKLVNTEDIKFYRKRIINTTRVILKKITDISQNDLDDTDKLNEGIINNTAVKDALYNYLKVLIYAYKQDDIKDIINRQNGFTEEYFENKNQRLDTIEETEELIETDIHKIDTNIFKKTTNIKNRYDWGQYCKIEKKVTDLDKETMPKINKINLKDPSLRTKGIKNKKI